MNGNKRKYEVLVVGAGHAGCEAALASARMGLKTFLLTINLNKVALMPCNPSIGGIGKGHLVREVDALGGEMARNIDATCIQIKTLNSSKGPAVRALRAQADKRLYEQRMRRTLLAQENLDLFQGLIDSLIIRRGRVQGVVLFTGEKIHAKTVILTTGTFLNGRIVVGSSSWAAGRMGEKPAKKLVDSLKRAGVITERFQTATPPRVDGRTLDYNRMNEDPGQENLHFSLRLPEEKLARKSCFITHTNRKTSGVIKEHINESPIKTGVIESHGPRYCPSIDRKIINFPDKEKHPVFVEPEGLQTIEMYLQGLTTAMPPYIQHMIVRSVEGLENAHIVRFGYAVEYDYAPPQQMMISLESKTCENLFLAGQLIGTTGYEEAAALGLMAGINAASKVKGEKPLILGRDEAYIGVLIDDLVTKGVDEPYRMFTSRAEYRLLLRSDNAHFRLTPKAYEIGLVDANYLGLVANRQKRTENLVEKLNGIRIPNHTAKKILSKYHQTKVERAMTAGEIISRPHVEIEDCVHLNEEREIIKNAEIHLKYGGYIRRQEDEAKRLKRFENTAIPLDLCYKKLAGLSFESREKLNKIKPITIGQASRIPGITPADISVLSIHIKQKAHGAKSKRNIPVRN